MSIKDSKDVGATQRLPMIDADLHKVLKMAGIKLGCTMREVAERAVREFLEKNEEEINKDRSE